MNFFNFELIVCSSSDFAQWSRTPTTLSSSTVASRAESWRKANGWSANRRQRCLRPLINSPRVDDFSTAASLDYMLYIFLIWYPWFLLVLIQSINFYFSWLLFNFGVKMIFSGRWSLIQQTVYYLSAYFFTIYIFSVLFYMVRFESITFLTLFDLWIWCHACNFIITFVISLLSL